VADLFSEVLQHYVLKKYFSYIAIYLPLLKYKIMEPLLVFKSFRNFSFIFSGYPKYTIFLFFPYTSKFCSEIV